MILRQYFKFFVNGGLLGFVALFLQGCTYRVLGGQGSIEYAAASALTYLPLVLINFAIQRAWVFNRSGILWRFVIVNLTIMILVSALSPVCKLLIDWLFGTPWGARTGFIVAAVLGSVPSFLAKRKFVFGI